MLKVVAVVDLKPGMLVTQVLSQSGPVKIRKVGMIRSPDMIKGLKEMGVTEVEVDLAQSLHIEDEEDATVQLNAGEINSVTELAEEETSTQTQKLVASDKQIADVDRQLSQQFHRSLFLPAVDQMPSKWTLYGRPYALLLLVVLTGLCIGWGASYGTYHLLNAPEQQNLSQQSLDSPRSEKLNETSLNEVSEAVDGDETTVVIKEEDQINATEPSDLSVSAPVESIPTSQESLVPEAPLAENNTPRQEVNGVVLEEGQQVLGYQGDEPIVYDAPETVVQQPTQTVIPPVEPATNEDIINPELYRRIQEAAKAVEESPESQEQNLVNVTDLNDLPRIDQLSPATLTQLPAMSFSAHMYASNPQDRWVRVNSRRLGEGDYIADNLQLKRIESEKVVLSFNGQDFTMNALSDW